MVQERTVKVSVFLKRWKGAPDSMGEHSHFTDKDWGEMGRLPPSYRSVMFLTFCLASITLRNEYEHMNIDFNFLSSSLPHCPCLHTHKAVLYSSQNASLFSTISYLQGKTTHQESPKHKKVEYSVYCLLPWMSPLPKAAWITLYWAPFLSLVCWSTMVLRI